MGCCDELRKALLLKEQYFLNLLENYNEEKAKKILDKIADKIIKRDENKIKEKK